MKKNSELNNGSRINKTIPLDVETVKKVQQIADSEDRKWAAVARRIFVNAVARLK